MIFTVTKSPSELAALTNCVFVNPTDLNASVVKYLCIKEDYILSVKSDAGVPKGQLGFSSTHRNWMMLALNEQLKVEAFDPEKAQPNYGIDSVNIQIGTLKKNVVGELQFDTKKLEAVMKRNFGGQVLMLGQPIVMDMHGVNLLLSVHAVSNTNLEGIARKDPNPQPVPSEWGVLMEHTGIKFFPAADSKIFLTGSVKNTFNPNPVVKPDFRFEDLGIGGLESEFGAIFRRAFASRIYPPAVVEKLGIQHVRGMLLYGPPGTGKTLMARQIGKMLNAREPKIVNGPEVLNKYVGQSEENVRNLFKEAEQEYKQKGDLSGLHIIIFDELDAVCKQRGNRADSTGVGDSVVNQLLAKLDGVEQLNNILLIGMTNRLDLVDEALLRPGRLEVHMEIGLPDAKGRLEILMIHTAKMRKHDKLASDVDLAALAEETKNFSGAELTGLIKSATSFAFNRHIKVGLGVEVDEESLDALQVCWSDFREALREVKAAYGVAEDEFASIGVSGVVEYSPSIREILADGRLAVDQVRNSKRAQLVTLLLHGAPGTGKSTLAAQIALSSGFPFVKLISAEQMVGMSEAQKIQKLTHTFENAYRSEQSCLVVDGLERIIEYSAAGPRFSNAILQTVAVLLNKVPPPGRRLLVIATIGIREMLRELIELEFTRELVVPSIISTDELEKVLTDYAIPENHLTEGEAREIINSINRQQFIVGVKKLLAIIEMAGQETENRVHCFLDAFQAQIIN